MRISKSHCILLRDAIIGIFKKWSYSFKSIPSLSNYEHGTQSDLIVSLTSYGDRVERTVYYTIVSLLKQTLKPAKIILWLDEENWSEDNIPHKLKRLIKKGVEIKFCKDLKSYKKLIPTIKKYPDAVIVTVDDDVIYSKKLLETLYAQHSKTPESIICTRGYKVKFKDGIPVPYKAWINIAKDLVIGKEEVLFPVGIGGVLYPPHSLHQDVVDEEKFMRLCPNADDIWFWFCAKLKKSNHQFIRLPNNYYSFDAIYQAFHRGSALTHSNVTENKNDVQLKNLLKEYNYNGLNADMKANEN